MTSLREAKKQMTRRLLLENGLQSFEAHGYAATTIEDIAAAAGTTRATFYLHFASKAQLMGALVLATDELFTATDLPPLTTLVESGTREQVTGWLSCKVEQWSTMRPYLMAVQQAATDPEIHALVDEWHDATIAEMVRGLDRATRFGPSVRSLRCVLAFGELESLSRRWMRQGWYIDRETAVSQLASSWCHLLLE